MAQPPIIPEIAYADPWRLYPKVAPYNPSDLVGRKGYRIFRIMLKDEQVKAALAFKKHSALASGWRVKSPDGEDESFESRIFVDRVLNGVLCGMNCALKNMLSMLEWGFSVSELIWVSSDGELRIVDIKTRHPAHIHFLQDVHGNVIEIQQQAPPGLIVLPEQKVVVLSNDDNFSNPYGTSDLESAYRAWWSKENAYRWLAMLLEKFGIPPVFAMYNPNRYQGQILTGLKDVLSGMQASTVGLVPRNAKDDIEMWAPSLADNVGDVFLPALDRYDRDISRAILIPNLLGITPEESTGSQARAATIFDGFLFVVERLRQQLADAVNVKIVKPLVDLNFAGDMYPIFEFIPISDDKRIGLLDVWQRLVASGAVTRTDTDQQHIRAILEFPEASSEEDDDLLEESLSQQEDFAAIAKTLDSIESVFVEGASAEIEKRISRIEKLIPNLGLADIPRLRLTFGLRAPLRGLIFGAFDSGGIIKQFQELPKVVPRDAIRALKAKILIMETTANADILKIIKQVLLTGIESGATTQDVIAALRVALQPWIGSPQLLDGKPIPKGRLEAIARTESTAAFNTGRIISGRKLGSLIQAFRFDAILDTRTSAVCFTGETSVISVGCLRRVFRTDYKGKIVIITTARGNKIAGTPNHPILTSMGWLPLDKLKPGEHIVYTPFLDSLAAVGEKNVNVPPTFSQLYDAVNNPAVSEIKSFRSTTADFYGDGMGGDSEVYVVDIKSQLRNNLQPGPLKHFKNEILSWIKNRIILPFKSCLDQGLTSWRKAVQSPEFGVAGVQGCINTGFRSSGYGGYFAWPFTLIKKRPDNFSIAKYSVVYNSTLSRLHHASLLKKASNSGGRDIELSSNTSGGKSAAIHADSIISVKSEYRTCHVYTLENSQGYYIAGGLIVKNCQFLDGKLFKAGDSDLDSLSPALHPNCRSILTPLSISQELDESDFITPSEVGEAKELAAAGFAGVKSI